MKYADDQSNHTTHHCVHLLDAHRFTDPSTYIPETIQGSQLVSACFRAHPEVDLFRYMMLFYFARQICTLHPTIKGLIICGNNAARIPAQELLMKNRRILRNVFMHTGPTFAWWLRKVKCYLVKDEKTMKNLKKHVNYNLIGASEAMRNEFKERERMQHLQRQKQQQQQQQQQQEGIRDEGFFGGVMQNLLGQGIRQEMHERARIRDRRVGFGLGLLLGGVAATACLLGYLRHTREKDD